MTIINVHNERDFLAALATVCAAAGVPENRVGMVEMACVENATGPAHTDWFIAGKTLQEYEDQGVVLKCAMEGSAY
jgi:hypothetical protein